MGKVAKIDLEEGGLERLRELVREANVERLEIYVSPPKAEAVEKLRDFLLEVQRKGIRVWLKG